MKLLLGYASPYRDSHLDDISSSDNPFPPASANVCTVIDSKTYEQIWSAAHPLTSSEPL